MLGWFGDFGRLAWGLIYWNGRKTLFRIGGARGQAPCQHPSDSGSAHQTACEACRDWRRAERFQKFLCPLLEISEGRSPVCSVDAARVRPFWGRVLAFYLGTLGAIYLVGIGAAFTGFRLIGYRVPVRVLAWPPSWRRIRQARADYFEQLAFEAYKKGDIRKCLLALAQVYQLDPGNFESARLFARYLQLGEPDYSDRIYSGLIQDHPEHAEQTAQEWFRALLVRGDFPAVARLSARMIRSHPVRVSAWIEALLFAEARIGDSAEIQRLMAKPGAIPEEAAVILGVATKTQTPEQRIQSLSWLVRSAATPYEMYYSLKSLIRLNRSEDVLRVLSRQTLLPEHDREFLRLSAYCELGWGSLERGEIGLILGGSPSDDAAGMIAAVLIVHPDRLAADQLFEYMDEGKLPATAAHLSAHSALLCLAGSDQDWTRFAQQSDAIARIVGKHSAVESRIRSFFEDKEAGRNLGSFLPTMDQLSIDVIYALHERYPAPKPAAKPVDA